MCRSHADERRASAETAVLGMPSHRRRTADHASLTTRMANATVGRSRLGEGRERIPAQCERGGRGEAVKAEALLTLLETESRRRIAHQSRPMSEARRRGGAETHADAGRGSRDDAAPAASASRIAGQEQSAGHVFTCHARAETIGASAQPPQLTAGATMHTTSPTLDAWSKSAHRASKSGTCRVPSVLQSRPRLRPFLLNQGTVHRHGFPPIIIILRQPRPLLKLSRSFQPGLGPSALPTSKSPACCSTWLDRHSTSAFSLCA